MNVTDALRNVVSAWEATKPGTTSVYEIQRWLIEDMKPAIDSARAALSLSPPEWQPIETAPKDGTRMLWAGKWKPFDILPGGEWTQQIFNWGTVMSDGTGYCWMSENFFPPGHWNVVWTHWRPLPTSPVESSTPAALEEKHEPGTIRICPMRDGPCPHGLSCPYVGDGYMGYPCKEGWRQVAGRAALERSDGERHDA